MTTDRYTVSIVVAEVIGGGMHLGLRISADSPFQFSGETVWSGSMPQGGYGYEFHGGPADPVDGSYQGHNPSAWHGDHPLTLFTTNYQSLNETVRIQPVLEVSGSQAQQLYGQLRDFGSRLAAENISYIGVGMVAEAQNSNSTFSNIWNDVLKSFSNQVGSPLGDLSDYVFDPDYPVPGITEEFFPGLDRDLFDGDPWRVEDAEALEEFDEFQRLEWRKSVADAAYAKAVKDSFARAEQYITPLVLDLDGDGIELTERTAGEVSFDLDGDGFAEWTGWVAPDDGILALDVNGNGRIDDISEVFGNATTDGFTELSALDDNNDGVIDAADAAFADLVVWVDANQDGITDDGELHTLADLEIQSISLAATQVDLEQAGNLISHVSSYTTTTGISRDIVDVWFELDQMNARYIGEYSLTRDGLYLPNARGYGVMPDLHIAISQDPGLADLVRDLTNTPLSDIHTTRDQVEDILFRWAGQQDVDPDSHFLHTDARIIGTLEAFTGTPFDDRGGSEFYAAGRQQVAAAWNTLVSAVHIRLLVQGPLKDAFPDIRFDFTTDTLTGTADMDAAVDILAASAPVGDTQAFAVYWRDMVVVLDTVARSIGRGPESYTDPVQQVVESGGLGGAFLLPQPFEGVTDHGSSGADTLNGSQFDDVFQGGVGDDVLNGGGGNDVYLFGVGSGHDRIVDGEWKGSDDRLVLLGLNRDDVTLTRPHYDINDVIVTIKATGETVTLVDLTDGNHIGIEHIDFADGTSIFGSKAEIGPIATIVGTDGNDVINGSNSINDVINGGRGDDVINGGGGDDTYVWRMGDGNDRIIDPVWAGGSDRVIFEDVNFDDVVLTRPYDDINDVIVTIIATGETVTLVDLTDGNHIGIEHIDFADGTSIFGSKAEIGPIATIVGTDGNDVINGSNSINDVINGGRGDDVINGGGGDDTYVWRMGDGNDRIIDPVWAGGSDRVIFEDVNFDDVVLTRPYDDINDVIVTVIATGETVTLVNLTDGNNAGVEYIDFADGTSIFGSKAEIGPIATIVGTDGDDIINGSNSIYDVIDCGLGDDVINGGDWDDTYIWRMGDGNDRIIDPEWAGGSDRIIFEDVPL